MNSKKLVTGLASSLLVAGLFASPASASPVNLDQPAPAPLAATADNSQTIRYTDGNELTAVLDSSEENVAIYLNGAYVKSVPVSELQTKTQELQDTVFKYSDRSACGHALNAVAAANGALWVVAGLSAGTANLPAAAVAGTEGVVTSAIIGAAGAEC